MERVREIHWDSNFGVQLYAFPHYNPSIWRVDVQLPVIYLRPPTQKLCLRTP